MTREGYVAQSEELRRLRSEERPRVIQAIAEARAHGDLSENAEYHAARERQGFIEARIAELEDKLSRAVIVEFDGTDPDRVRFGAWVTLTHEETGDERRYRIVGDLEADIAQNRISVSSPIARAVLGKRTGDLVTVSAPRGPQEYSITDVTYAAAAPSGA